MMCGTGRVSVPLLEAGVDLTCVDASEGMLARLEERLHARKLDARVMWADVRYLDLREEFYLALVPFHSISELVSPGDQKLALRAVHSCLREGGRLVCPLHNPAIRARSADGAFRLNGRFPTGDGGLLVISGFDPWTKAPVWSTGYSSTSSSTLQTNCAPSAYCPCASP